MESICKLFINDCRALFHKYLSKIECTYSRVSNTRRVPNKRVCFLIFDFFPRSYCFIKDGKYAFCVCNIYLFTALRLFLVTSFPGVGLFSESRVRSFCLPFKVEVCYTNPGDISLLHSLVKKGSNFTETRNNIPRYTGQFLSEFDFNIF